MSPLVRTLETAAGVFGAEGVGGPTRLMLPTKAARHECTAHDAIAAPPTPPFVASGMCRERMGKTPVQHIGWRIKAFLVTEGQKDMRRGKSMRQTAPIEGDNSRIPRG